MPVSSPLTGLLVRLHSSALASATAPAAPMLFESSSSVSRERIAGSAVAENNNDDDDENDEEAAPSVTAAAAAGSVEQQSSQELRDAAEALAKQQLQEEIKQKELRKAPQ